jgi:pSer/pThr/pTyr-binding forkhead associated (FHA) protein
MDVIKLVVVEGNLKGKFAIGENMTCVIGRANDCTIMIPKEADAHISRHHCRIDVDFPKVLLRDMNSRNGTYLNGLLLGSGSQDDKNVTKSYLVEEGDIIKIGETGFKVEFLKEKPLSAQSESKKKKPSATKTSIQKPKAKTSPTATTSGAKKTSAGLKIKSTQNKLKIKKG